MTEMSDPAATARKRRKAIIDSQRGTDADHSHALAAVGGENVPFVPLVVPNVVDEITAAALSVLLPPQQLQAKEQEEREPEQQQAQEPEAQQQQAQQQDDDDDDEGSLPSPQKKRKSISKHEKSGSDTDSDDNKKKTQIRYDPDIPMGKEQLAAWRREARRVRNRESAAASRQRIRNRINELESEVGQWKSKYQQAMERLQQLESSSAAGPSSGTAA